MGDGDDVEHEGGDGDFAVEGAGLGDEGPACGEFDGGLCGGVGELFDGAINGHGLGALDDALAGGEFGVLTGDEDAAGEAFLGEGLDGSACGAVVAGKDGVDGLGSGAGDGGVGDFFGVLRFPIGGPVFEYDLNATLINEWLEDGVLAVFDVGGVVVGFGAVDADDAHGAVGGEAVGEELGLELADFEAVKGEVEVGVAIHEESIVGDDGDVCSVGECDGFCHGFAIAGDDDEDIDALGEEALDLGELEGVVAIGGLHEHVCLELFGALSEEVAIHLPAFFFDGFHGKADQRAR